MASLRKNIFFIIFIFKKLWFYKTVKFANFKKNIFYLSLKRLWFRKTKFYKIKKKIFYLFQKDYDFTKQQNLTNLRKKYFLHYIFFKKSVVSENNKFLQNLEKIKKKYIK